MNAEFQIIFGLGSGLFLGVFSLGLIPTLFLILMFEFIIYATGKYPRDDDVTAIRILINVVFFFGWIISHFLLTRDTGCEDAIDQMKYCYETFPN